MSKLELAVVTGANRGLGLEVSRQLAHKGLKVILTSRDTSKGQQAVRLLKEEGLAVYFHALDATDGASIDVLAQFIRAEFGRLDILVNNAGIFPDPVPWNTEASSSVFDTNIAILRQAMETNTFGPLLLCQRLIPLMDGFGRVVNVSSGMGQLAEMNGCCPGYRLSKTALNAVTRIFAEELQATGVKVNSVCPGWVRTDMGSEQAERSVQEGAAGIVGLATLPDDGPSGGFFRDMQLLSW